jgi:hypothetical protein
MRSETHTLTTITTFLLPNTGCDSDVATDNCGRREAEPIRYKDKRRGEERREERGGAFIVSESCVTVDCYGCTVRPKTEISSNLLI